MPPEPTPAPAPQKVAGATLALVLGFAAAVGALLAFAALAQDVRAGMPAIDQEVLATLQAHQSPALDVSARFASALGSEVVALLVVVLTAYFAWRRRWRSAGGLLLTTVGAQVLNDVLKAYFHRPRPAPLAGIIPAQAFSFPSGHAMVSAAFYLYVAYLTWRFLRGWQRVVWIALLFAIVLAIGLSRMYLGVHYLTDVAAGYSAGFLWTDSVVIASRVLRNRDRGAAPAGP